MSPCANQGMTKVFDHGAGRLCLLRQAILMIMKRQVAVRAAPDRDRKCSFRNSLNDAALDHPGNRDDALISGQSQRGERENNSSAA